MIAALLLLALQDPAPVPSARAAQRLELLRDVSKLNGAWKLHEWGHYFVLTNVNDPKFLPECERKAFEARERCSRLFPQAESDPVRDDRKLVVLRVARDREQYQSYGGPGGSNGYWSALSGEIVVHDDPERSQTWEALAGCVALAFLDEFFGDAPRAEWFELGLSEYCKSAVRERELTADQLASWPTLDALLARPRGSWLRRLDQVPRPQLEAWSLMRFLCDEEFRGPGFDARWARIPERYAVGWLALTDEQKACDFAFEGLDRGALERAWRASLVPR